MHYLTCWDRENRFKHAASWGNNLWLASPSLDGVTQINTCGQFGVSSPPECCFVFESGMNLDHLDMRTHSDKRRTCKPHTKKTDSNTFPSCWEATALTTESLCCLSQQKIKCDRTSQQWFIASKSGLKTHSQTTAKQ